MTMEKDTVSKWQEVQVQIEMLREIDIYLELSVDVKLGFIIVDNTQDDTYIFNTLDEVKGLIKGCQITYRSLNRIEEKE